MDKYIASYFLSGAHFQRSFMADDLSHAAEQALDAAEEDEFLTAVTIAYDTMQEIKRGEREWTAS